MFNFQQCSLVLSTIVEGSITLTDFFWEKFNIKHAIQNIYESWQELTLCNESVQLVKAYTRDMISYKIITVAATTVWHIINLKMFGTLNFFSCVFSY